jgi:hypothetical protein
MTDYILCFSIEIKDATDQEIAWLEEHRVPPNEPDENGDEYESNFYRVTKHQPDVVVIEDDDGSEALNYDFDQKTAEIISEFLKNFPRHKYISFIASEVIIRHINSTFKNSHAYFVTKDRVKRINLEQWLQDQEGEYLK